MRPVKSKGKRLSVQVRQPEQMLRVVQKHIETSLPYYTQARALDRSEYPKYGDYEFSLVMEGSLQLAEQSVTIQIALDNHFPLHKPLFFLKPYDALGFIPHVDICGLVCYVRDEGVVLDTEDVLGVIDESFEKVTKTLDNGISGINSNDIQEEFEAYWIGLDNVSLVESNVEITSNVKTVKVVEFEHYPRLFIGDSIRDIEHYCRSYIGTTRMGKPTTFDGLYIPLREGTAVRPPYYGEFWTVKQFRNLIYGNITSSNKRLLKELVKSRVNHSDVLIVIVSIPLSNGHRAVVGVKYSEFTAKQVSKKRPKRRFSHPLHRADANCRFVPLGVIRHDKSYITPRGGGNNLLSEKTVAVIGCGSVGGYVALELAKAGVQKISLIDQDQLMQENIYRHVLGADSLLCPIYKCDTNVKEPLMNPKIFGLKNEIERKLPYADINIAVEHEDRIESILSSNTIDFRGFDLVISAMGNPTIELYLNDFFHRNESMPPIIFTWVEAYGIGGHAILTKNCGKRGCLRCLYEDSFDENTSLYNKASFAEGGQDFTTQITGCGSAYTPYGSLDAVQTAILTTRLAIDVLTGREKDNPVLSWKGNVDTFLENGFELSSHHSISIEKLYDTRYLYKNTFCRSCGHSGDAGHA